MLIDGQAGAGGQRATFDNINPATRRRSVKSRWLAQRNASRESLPRGAR